MIAKLAPLALVDPGKDQAGTYLSWIFDLQVEQRIHDDRHHPEISRLPLHHRLNHLALHFAKYAGRIADAIRTDDHTDISRTLTDTFIIALSAANVLNLRLDDALIAHASADARHADRDVTDLLVELTSASGKLARACEAVDHLEARPLREEMCSEIVTLANLAFSEAVSREMDMLAAVRSRLEQVRQTKIFNGTF